MYPEYARDTFTTWKLAHRNEDFSLNVDATIKAGCSRVVGVIGSHADEMRALIDGA